MFVKAQCKRGKVTGLFLDDVDVLRHFPDHLTDIDLRLGHLCIQCRLQPDFWKGAPIIRDSRLCEWLEFRHFAHGQNHDVLPWTLISAGGGAFELEPAHRSGHE